MIGLEAQLLTSEYLLVKRYCYQKYEVTICYQPRWSSSTLVFHPILPINLIVVLLKLFFFSFYDRLTIALLEPFILFERSLVGEVQNMYTK